MTEKQTAMLKLGLAAKGVPPDLADAVIEVIEESRAALVAYTQQAQAQAQALKHYIESALMLAEVPGANTLADRLFAAAATMIGAPDKVDGAEEPA